MGKIDNPPAYNEVQYPAPSASTAVIVTQAPMPPAAAVVIGMPVQYGPTSQNTICPHCHHHILTRVQADTSSRTHLYALLLFALLCWPCMCIPYCMDSCKNRNHYCPKCGAFLGTYKD